MTTTRLATLAAAAVLSASTAMAAPIYGTPAPSTGTRTEGAGITTFGDYATDGITQSLSWSITLDGDGKYTYSYRFSGFGGPAVPTISHFILDLTDDCVDPGDAGCVIDPSDPSTEFKSFDGTDPSNPGMPGTIVGVKFDSGCSDADCTFTFRSERAPTYGDFYVKSGSATAAWNPGLAAHTSSSVLDFIARPNGDDETIPEPATLGLMGLALAFGASRLRRQ
jgi:hypothetical protein